ncbi:MAG: hypothetical protein CMQ24_10920 [Gammaproteobacteria bacterium]|nr:hypothetical protein [Gammaproteobacteria bacterium]
MAIPRVVGIDRFAQPVRQPGHFRFRGFERRDRVKVSPHATGQVVQLRVGLRHSAGIAAKQHAMMRLVVTGDHAVVDGPKYHLFESVTDRDDEGPELARFGHQLIHVVQQCIVAHGSKVQPAAGLVQLDIRGKLLVTPALHALRALAHPLDALGD